MLRRSAIFSNLSAILLGFGLYDAVYGTWNFFVFQWKPIQPDEFTFDRFAGVVWFFSLAVLFLCNFKELNGPINARGIDKLMGPIGYGAPTIISAYFCLGPRSALVFGLAFACALLAALSEVEKD